MDNYHESKLSMYLTFEAFQAAYMSITNPLPGYAENHKVFSGIVPKIQAYSSMLFENNEGIVTNKKKHKSTLSILIVDKARKMRAFALHSNNDKLLSQTKITKTMLRSLADTAVIDHAKLVYDKGNQYLENLERYGITKENQAAFLKAIEAFQIALTEPRVNQTETNEYTRKRDMLFKEADHALAMMDAAVDVVSLDQPDFYRKYKEARKIILTGKRSLAVKGMVCDAHSDKGIQGATLEFVPQGASEAPDTTTTKVTAAKGGFRVRSLPSGRYTVRVRKVGYADHETTLVVDGIDLAVLSIRLSKN